MNGDQNNLLLEEVYKAAQMGLDATNIILKKVKVEPLKDYLTSQSKNYTALSDDVKKELKRRGDSPKDTPLWDKAMLWGSIQMNTLTDMSDTKIAEMMINGSTMGIVDITKKMNEYPEAEKATRELCRRFIQHEERHIENMKGYL